MMAGTAALVQTPGRRGGEVKRARNVALVALAALAAWSCRRSARVDEAYEAADAAYEKAATAEEKVAVWEAFLSRYPATEHTTDAVQTVVYHLGHELRRPAEADDFVRRALPGIRNSERRREVSFERLALLAELGRTDELRTLAAELSASRALTYREAVAIADAASSAGAWDLALASYRTALPFATEAAFRAENAGAKLSDDRVERSVRRRQASVYTGIGWAESNLGRVNDALQWFANARRVDLTRYLGNTDSRLGLYQGRTLLAAGRVDEALTVLALEALFGGEAEAMDALRQAYAAKTGGSEGFEAFLAHEREHLARPAAEFVLPDYDGTPHAFSDLRNGEVALLAFWFPT